MAYRPWSGASGVAASLARAGMVAWRDKGAGGPVGPRGQVCLPPVMAVIRVLDLGNCGISLLLLAEHMVQRRHKITLTLS